MLVDYKGSSATAAATEICDKDLLCGPHAGITIGHESHKDPVPETHVEFYVKRFFLLQLVTTASYHTYDDSVVLTSLLAVAVYAVRMEERLEACRVEKWRQF